MYYTFKTQKWSSISTESMPGCATFLGVILKALMSRYFSDFLSSIPSYRLNKKYFISIFVYVRLFAKITKFSPTSIYLL